MANSVQIRNQSLRIDLDAMTQPEGYIMDDNDLRAAANAALLLGKPLLLTGEAGVGKSQFASWLAKELALDAPLKFVVKSTTEARDLFYHYDSLARFHEAQVSQFANGAADPLASSRIDPHRYVTYNALGLAILCSLGETAARIQGFVTPSMGNVATKLPDQPRRTVVLIDEIDKAPRDVPNDILDEIDNLSFTVRELGNLQAKASKELRPVVVMTSNSERDLPKPFLRRCVYYHMNFPSPEALDRIVNSRVGARYQSAKGSLGQAVRFFRYLRDRVSLRQRPGLAELLDFLYALSERAAGGATLGELPGIAAIVKATLLKDRNDQTDSERDWSKWMKESQS